MRRRLEVTLLLLLLGLVIGMLLAPKVRAVCHSIEVTWWSPSGTAGCEVYGEGLASFWGGPGVARNDCEWPWDRCQPITITALETGRSLTVFPSMFGDLYTGTPNQRIVDLDPAALSALGLDPTQGLFPVIVEPATPSLPDTALPSSG